MNKKYNGYLLITDMDGTLLNTNKEISVQNKLAIESFIENGGKFSVATGRSPASAERWLKQLPINHYCIFYNGSMVKDLQNNNVLSCAYLEKVKFVSLVEHILNVYKDVVVEIFTKKGLFVVSSPDVKDPYLEQEKDPYIQGDLSDVINMDWIKILLCSKHDTLEKIESVIKNKKLDEFCHCFYSQDFFLEMTPKNKTKGTALKYIRENSNISKIIAVGDYENDEQMLKNADLGVAVGNAIESLKQKADYVSTDNNHHPISDILKYLSQKVL